MNFLGSWEEFDEIQFCVCCCDLVWVSVRYLEKTFLIVKRNSIQSKGIVCHHEGEINADYSKMSLFMNNIGKRSPKVYCNLCINLGKR